MAEIQLSGLATGLDTAKIIEQLMQVEQRRLITYQNTESRYTEKRDVINELQAKLSAFKASLKNLADSSQLRSFSTTTSDSDVLTASANANAYEGNHQVQIKQLATSDRWVHDGYKYETSYVGEGSFIFSYNHQEVVIQTTAETTLEDLVTLINNDPDNPGVTAGILKYDNGSGGVYHLVLSGRQSGTDYQVSVNSSNTEVHTADSVLQYGGGNAELSTLLKDLDDFSGVMESGSTSDQIRVTGTTHDGTAVDVSFDVTQYTSIEDVLGEIEDAFGGTVKAVLDEGQIKITDTTSGASSLTVNLSFVAGTGSTASWTPPTISQNVVGGSITADIASLAAGTFTETQSAQDALIKVDDYPSGADNWISRSSNTIDDVIAGVTLKLHDTTDDGTGGYDSIEVNLNRDTETLKENLNSMIEAYNTVIMYIDEKSAYDEENRRSGVLSSDYALGNIGNMIKLPIITNATGFGSNDAFVNPKDIGLTVDADGMLSLDENTFDEAIVDNYLGVLSLIGAAKKGASSGTDAAYVKFYGASKYTTAGTYDVRVTVDGSGTITSALFKKSDEDWSQAREGTIDGNYILGNTDLDSDYRPVNPEFDLQLSVDTSQTGRTMEVTVTVKQGFAGNLYEQTEDLLSFTDGRITIARDSIQDQIGRIEKRIEEEEDRLTRVEARLQAQFARLERNLQMIEQQMSGLRML